MIWWLRLAVLWGCNWTDARARCNSYDLELWKAYYGIEPWGGRADDERAGQICATVFNYGGMSKPKRALADDDFFPRLAAPRRRKTAMELRQAAKEATAAMGGKVQ